MGEKAKSKTVNNDFEYLLTQKAWQDPAFAKQLATNPEAALVQLGVSVPKNIKLKVIIQKPNTLYFTIPALKPNVAEQKDFELTQMDIWSSGKMFIWLAPSKHKVKLLQLRNSIYEKEKHHGQV